MLQLTRHPDSSPRRGFSMVELLVVMGIIALLAAILIPTIGRSIGLAKEKATIVTMKKVHEMLNQRREEFLLATLDNKLWPHQRTLGVNSDDGINLIYARKIWAKGVFPQRFEDLVGPDGVPGALDSRRTLDIDDDGDSNADFEGGRVDIEELGPLSGNSDDVGLAVIINNKIASGQFDKSKHTLATESSELLFLALTESTSFGTSTVDAGEFKASELGDTDGDGLIEIIDGWGNPIRFYRWPTNLIRPHDLSGPRETNVQVAAEYFIKGNPSAPAGVEANNCWALISDTPIDLGMASKDPDDPLNKVGNAGANVTRNRGSTSDVPTFMEGDADADGTGDNLVPEFTFHPQFTYHTLLLISAGFDGQLGLFETPEVATFGHLAQPRPETLANPNESALIDNITNLNMGGL